jgi:hypothetical protein
MKRAPSIAREAPAKSIAFEQRLARMELIVQELRGTVIALQAQLDHLAARLLAR